jgi:rhodanese-related sulfurtransferase
MAQVREISPRALKERLDRGEELFVLDVREPEEAALAPFAGAMNIPMGDVPSRLSDLDPDRETVVVCHHGIRSAQVAKWLAGMDFGLVANLTGGIDAWSLTIDPSTPRY